MEAVKIVARDELAVEPNTASPGLLALDPLKEVRDLKRKVQLGVYGTILAFIPFDAFLIRQSPFELLVNNVLYVVIATVAIEGAFSQMCKLRKRSAYPGALIMALGDIQALATACQRSLEIIRQLVNTRAAFLALQVPSSQTLTLSGLSGLTRLEAERFFRIGELDIADALKSGEVVYVHAQTLNLLAAALANNECLALAPVLALQRPIGILGLVGAQSNRDLMDSSLVSGLGIALGLSLESLRQKEELRETATIDELTRVYNRRHFFEQLERELSAARRYDVPLAVILVDLDGLKRINDTYGHQTGDQALRTVAQTLVRHTRAADIISRIGGDEFAIILPRTDKQGALDMTLRLAEAVDNQPIPLPDDTALTLSVSCGASAYPDDGDDLDALLRDADASMYGVKAGRRNNGT